MPTQSSKKPYTHKMLRFLNLVALFRRSGRHPLTMVKINNDLGYTQRCSVVSNDIKFLVSKGVLRVTPVKIGSAIYEVVGDVSRACKVSKKRRAQAAPTDLEVSRVQTVKPSLTAGAENAAQEDKLSTGSKAVVEKTILQFLADHTGNTPVLQLLTWLKQA